MSDKEILLVDGKFSENEWEDLCLKCGECCKTFSKEGNFKGFCKHLNKDKICNIYGKSWGEITYQRGDYVMSCVPVEFTFKRNKDCPYNKYIEKYQIYRVENLP